MNSTIPKDLLNGILSAGLRKPDYSAFILDFSGIPAADNNIVFYAFIRFVEEGCVGGVRGRLLAGNAVSVLVPTALAEKMNGFLEKLNGFLLSRHYGGLSVRMFDLSKSAMEFAVRCVEYIRGPQKNRAEDLLDFFQSAPANYRQLGQLIELERMVGQADLSMHVRLQSIWHLERNTIPALFGVEMWVAMAVMEEITGTSIMHDNWMFERFTELLDTRVLSYVTKECRVTRVRQFLNLNPIAVISDNFQRMVRAVPARQLRQLTVEISLTAWRRNVRAREDVLNRFERFGIGLAIDGIPVSELADLVERDIEGARYLKVNVAPFTPEEIEISLARCPKSILVKSILCRCENADQIAAGVEGGIRYFQGYGLSDFLDSPEQVAAVLGDKAADNLHQIFAHRTRRSSW